MRTEVEYLEEAKSLIVMHGWTKRKFKSWNGNFCALGAMNELRQNATDEECTVWYHARDYLYKALPEEYRDFGVVEYNDFTATSVEDIYALFDRAIEIAKANDPILGSSPAGKFFLTTLQL